MKKMWRRLLITILLLNWWLSQPGIVWAAPYFFIDGSNQMIAGYSYSYSVYLYTDDDTLTAAQSVLHFDSNNIKTLSINTIGTRCNFWSPADPSLNYGNQSTPYFLEDNKLVLACGFSNPGYRSSNSSADLVAKIQLTAQTTATGSSSMYFSDSMYRYIGNTVTPGVNRGLTISVYNSTSSANPTATPYPTPTSVHPTTVSSSDLNLVTIGTGSSTTSTSQSINLSSLNLNVTSAANQIGQASSRDDQIPAPPNLSPRPTSISLNQQMNDQQAKQSDPIGEVLSMQSLKELLLPGRSQADQTVVLVNLISALAFIAILTILIWRLIIVSRMNRIKYRHLTDILSGELSALESKLASEVSEENRDELNKQIEDVRQKIGGN
jgi:hypothetical protein